MYVVGYGLGRFWVEGLRIDEADALGGLRWNQWVALAAIVGGLGFLAVPARAEGGARCRPMASAECQSGRRAPVAESNR